MNQTFSSTSHAGDVPAIVVVGRVITPDYGPPRRRRVEPPAGPGPRARVLLRRLRTRSGGTTRQWGVPM